MSSNVKLEVAISAIPMIPITHISRLVWDERLGSRLERLRGKMSRRELCERLETAGFDLTVQGLAKFEHGKVDSIDARMIVTILAILGCGLEVLYPTVSHDARLIQQLEPAIA